MKVLVKQLTGVVAALCVVTVLIAASPHNGIQGQAVVVQATATGLAATPVQTTFAVIWVKNTSRQVTEVTTDASGRFSVSLQPGIYALLPAPVHFGSCVISTGPFSVTVDKKGFANVTISYPACANPGKLAGH